jgi:hypothetical protein
MTAKAMLKKVIAEMPEDCTFEEVQYRLYVMSLIRNRLDSARTTKSVHRPRLDDVRECSRGALG